MASDTKEKSGTAMAADVAGAGDDRERSEARAKPDYAGPGTSKSRSPGFFTIYKKGQGYWTRLGTALGASLIILLTVYFLYRQVPVWISPRFVSPDSASLITLAIDAAVLVALGLLVWSLINRPANADFLIATDTEMKKVNWTSRRELIGSTRVVILFMFFIAVLLFAIDLLFHTFFWAIGVLKTKPFFLD